MDAVDSKALFFHFCISHLVNTAIINVQVTFKKLSGIQPRVMLSSSEWSTVLNQGPLAL